MTITNLVLQVYTGVQVCTCGVDYLESTLLARLVVLQLHVIDATRRWSGTSRASGLRRRSRHALTGAVNQRDWTVSGEPSARVINFLLLRRRYTRTNTMSIHYSTVLLQYTEYSL